MKIDELGEKVKLWEAVSEIQLDSSRPILARLDGRSFHSFTKGMERPFDERMSLCMYYVEKKLVEETNAIIAYTQSDEISLLWQAKQNDDKKGKSEIWFNGRHSKMVSSLSALATLHFYIACGIYLSQEYQDKLPTFDARVWSVDDREQAVDVLRWRELDAIKNSVTMAATAHFSAKQLHKVGTESKIKMLMEIGVNFEDYPTYFKRGQYVRRCEIESFLTAQDIEKLPAKHNARINPELKVKRNLVDVIDMPPLSTIKNLQEVIFENAEPIFNK